MSSDFLNKVMVIKTNDGFIAKEILGLYECDNLKDSFLYDNMDDVIRDFDSIRQKGIKGQIMIINLIPIHPRGC